MQNSQVKRNRRRPHDYPERQVGYPERNDASNPDDETERIHVDFEGMEVSKKSPTGSRRDVRGPKVSP